ncbi:IS200/IS605 family transposase [Paraburkholderia youngii]|uniref:IS200/IS605 family transposase n=1 Tax=Paraburkholderia youngii TaxID=2782701 RepID=UPI003D1E2BE6
MHSLDATLLVCPLGDAERGFRLAVKLRHLELVFKKEHLEAMQQILANVCRDFEAELVEFNGEHDHVHLLVNYPPKVALSTLVASLKGVSSRMLRQQFGDFHPWLKRRGVLWSPSYFAASCGGAPLDILRQYIEQQQAPH